MHPPTNGPPEKGAAPRRVFLEAGAGKLTGDDQEQGILLFACQVAHGQLPQVVVTTDGSSFGNPGSAGWAAVIRCGGTVCEFSGAVGIATANRAELVAIRQALSKLAHPCRVVVRSDSQVAVLGCRRTVLGIGVPRRKPLANLDLLRDIAIVTVSAPKFDGDLYDAVLKYRPALQPIRLRTEAEIRVRI